MEKKSIGFIIIFSLIVFNSCLKEDVSNIGSEIHIQPEYAIPIGTIEASIGDYVGESSNLIPIFPEQLDAIPGFYFDDILYSIPVDLSHDYNIPFTLSSAKNNDTIVTGLMIRTNLKNNIPATMVLQAYFMNAFGSAIDSLYHTGPLVIGAATVDSDGDVTKTYESYKNDIEFELADIQKLTQTSSIKISAELHIENVGDIFAKYSSDQSLWFQLAADVKLDIKL